jgi:hypothetical protein
MGILTQAATSQTLLQHARRLYFEAVIPHRRSYRGLSLRQPVFQA